MSMTPKNIRKNHNIDMAVITRNNRFIIDYRPNGRHGRRIRLPLPPGITDVAEAKSIEQSLKEAARGQRMDSLADRNATVQGLFDEYLGWYKIRRSPRTWRDLSLTYEAHLKRLLGEPRIDALSNAHISLYQRLRHAEHCRVSSKKEQKPPPRPVSNRTINKELDYFRGFLKWCRREKGLECPIKHIDPLPESRPIPMVLSPEEVRMILDAADPFHRALILCLYSLGLRMDEARNIRVGDIDRQNKTVTVKQKGGSFKLLPLPPTLYSSLMAIIDPEASSQAVDFVFASKRQKKDDKEGKKSPIYDIRTALKRICAKAGVTKRVYPHLFRHSCATHLMGSGVNARVIQKYMGHAQLATTEFYTHVAAKHLDGAAGVMEGIIGKQRRKTPTKNRIKSKGVSTPTHR